MKVKFALLTILVWIVNMKEVEAQNPTYEWTKTYGGNISDQGRKICTDASGSVYVVGVFMETVDLNPGIGVDNRLSNGAMDVFVQKFDVNGNLVWVKTFGGTGDDIVNGFSIDVNDNVYLTGYFMDTVDFDPGPGIDDHISNGNHDMFVLKLGSNGNFIWAKTFGGMSEDYANGIVIDSLSGEVIVTGEFSYTVDFDPNNGLDEHTSVNGSFDVFVQKLDANGNFIWAKTFGGTDTDRGADITIDEFGNIYVVGSFMSSLDIDPGSGVDNRVSSGYYDVFVQKLDAGGNFIWANTYGSIQADNGTCIGTDALGNLYVAGTFMDTLDFDPGVGVDTHTSKGYYDIFIQKLDISGNFIWAKSFGGINAEQIRDISVGANNQLYITGYFIDTVDFDPGSGVNIHVSNGYHDVFVENFDLNGNVNWVSTYGSIYYDWGNGIAIDVSGNIYVTGFFSDSSDFDPGSGVDSHTSNGDADVFIQKLGPISASIKTEEKVDVFYTYPNPTKGILTVSIESDEVCSIKVLNVMGQVVASKNNVYNQTMLDLSQQVDGVYFVQIQGENKIVSSKVILQK